MPTQDNPTQPLTNNATSKKQTRDWKKPLLLFLLITIVVAAIAVAAVVVLNNNTQTPNTETTPEQTETLEEEEKESEEPDATPTEEDNTQEESEEAEVSYDVYFSSLSHPETKMPTLGVYPVSRSTTRTEVATFLIEQLLLGPTPEEEATTYFTSVVLDEGESYPGDYTPIEFTTAAQTRKYFDIQVIGKSVEVEFKAPMYFPENFSESLAFNQINDTLTQLSTVEGVYLTSLGDPCWESLSGMCGQQKALLESLTDRDSWEKQQHVRHTFSCDDGTKRTSGVTALFKYIDEPGNSGSGDIMSFAKNGDWIECASDSGAHATWSTYKHKDMPIYYEYFSSSSVGSGTESHAWIGF